MRPSTRSTAAANSGQHPQSKAASSNKRKHNASNGTEDPVRKKPRQRRWKKKRGELQDFLDMPLEIIFEIFSHLFPKDLLHLARTSKDLRAMLMSRSTVSVWKAARSNVLPIMPDCYPNMSEPEYTHFAFAEFCHYCNRSSKEVAVAVQWTARKIICQSCLPMYCKSATDWNDTKKIPEAVSIGKVFRGFDFREIVPCLGYNPNAGPGLKGSAFVEFLPIWEAEGKKIRYIKDRKKWLEKKIEEHKAGEKLSPLYRKWQEDREKWTMEEKERRIENRLIQVAQRVRELGWGDEVDLMSVDEAKFETLQETYRFCEKDLTESGWPEIDRCINAYMETVKSRRLICERDKLFTERIPVLREVREDIVYSFPYLTRPSLPTVGELWAHPSIRKTILEHPKGEVLTKADLAPTVTAVFPEMNEQLQSRIDQELLGKVHVGLGEMGQEDREVDPDTVFDLATTIFHCCGERLFWFRDIKAHECARDLEFPKSVAKEFVYANDHIHRGEKYHGHTQGPIGVWTTFNAKAAKVATELVKLCGLDPLTTTIQEMDELDPIFECLVCSWLQQSKGRCTMTWRTAIVHHAFRPHNVPYVDPAHRGADLDLMDEDEADIARARIDEQQRRRLYALELLNVCAHCDQLFMPLTELVKHVTQVHGIEEVTEEDMLPEPTNDQIPEPFYLWPPDALKSSS